MRALPHRPLLAGLAAALALAGLTTLPAVAAPPDAPSVPPQLLAAVQRDFGLTADQARARITAEAAAARTAALVRSRVGDRAAGLWFDAATGRLNAAVTTGADAELARLAGAVPRLVAHGPAELAATARTVTALVGQGVPGVHSWGPDVRGNRIEVTVARAGRTAETAAFLARLAELGPVVRVTESDDRAPRQQAEVVGGEKWIPGSESPCSIGFAVTRADGSRAYLTAGHCTNDADQAAYGKDGSRVGTSNRNGTGSINAREGDMGIVDVDQAAWTLSARVSGYGQADITVTGSVDAVVGTAICRSGQTTGLRCGEVTKVDQSVDYGNVVVDGLSYSSACSAGGDSGGAYVTATGGKAVGLHSGGGSATCTSGSGEKFTIFQPVNEALSRFNVALVVATPQPGAVTVAAVPAQSTVLGTSVELRNSAQGGTAPYTWAATGLPAGLAIAAATGTVTGTPTTAGSATVTVTATDSTGRTGSTGFGWTVTTGQGGGTPVLTNPGNQTVYVGKPVSLALKATGGTTPYTFKAVGLPAGLSIDPATGTVTGAPTTWGFRTSTLTVTDGSGRTSSVNVTWNVYF